MPPGRLIILRRSKSRAQTISSWKITSRTGARRISSEQNPAWAKQGELGNEGIELLASAELSEALDNVNAAVGIAPLVVVPGDHASVAVAFGLSHQRIED